MQVDISFPYAKVYDVDKIDIVLGQKFSLSTDTPDLKWFSDNDPVLLVKGNKSRADIEASALGESMILITDLSFAPLRQICVRVVDSIVEPATDLGLIADPAINKEAA